MEYHPLLEGAYELHCHSAPSIFPRSQTAWELVEDLKQAKMGGAILKAHEASTVDVASVIQMKEPAVHVFGGLVLNYFTGGICPFAVDAAIRQGAKIIWMPTISTKQHQNYFASRSTRLFQSKQSLPETSGVTIFDEQDQVRDEVYEVLDLISEAGIILATGHLSVREVDVLIEIAKERSVEKILVQHADLGIAKIPLDKQIKYARQGAIIEKCYLACSSDFNDLTISEMGQTINQIGAESCVLVTDYGQKHHIPTVQAFNKQVIELLQNGHTETDIETMIVKNPKQLLGLE